MERKELGGGVGEGEMTGRMREKREGGRQRKEKGR